MKKFIFTFLLVLAFVLPVHAAEMVTIENVSKSDVYNYVLTFNMKNGTTILENNEHSLIFRKDVPDLKFSSIWGSDAYVKYVYNFAQVEKNVLFSFEMQIISGQRVSPLTKESLPLYLPSAKDDAEKGYLGTIKTLAFTKHHFNGLCRYGFVPARTKKKNAVEIADVIANSPAEKAGLQKGDKITKIDSRPVKDMSYAIFESLLLQDTLDVKVMTLEVQIEKELLTFSITPQFYDQKL